MCAGTPVALFDRQRLARAFQPGFRGSIPATGVRMQPSMFNVRVPLADQRNGVDVVLMNTFTDAQLMVSRDVVDLLDRLEGNAGDAGAFDAEARATLEQLADQGFVVSDRGTERAELKAFFRNTRESTETLKVTVLTTLQC